jgi:hypothetical protein
MLSVFKGSGLPFHFFKGLIIQASLPFIDTFYPDNTSKYVFWIHPAKAGFLLANLRWVFRLLNEYSWKKEKTIVPWCIAL